MTEATRLQVEATKLLRKAGYTWAGRPKTSVSAGQAQLEKRYIRVPYGGQPKR